MVQPRDFGRRDHHDRMELECNPHHTCHRVVCHISVSLDGLLFITGIWQLRGSILAIAALALATAVVSRLFSILRLNPPADIAGLKPDDLDLLVATGPGVPGFELLGWILGALVFVHFIVRAARAA